MTPFEDSPTCKPARQSRSGETVLTFPGGPVVIGKPTREALLLSAQQWVDRVRDDIVDARHHGEILSSLRRLEMVLEELGTC